MRRPPLSSKSYISLRTMSVDSPTRWKTPMSSNIGLITRSYPAGSTMPANSATKASYRPDWGASTSKVPFGAWNSGISGRQGSGRTRSVRPVRSGDDVDRGPHRNVVEPGQVDDVQPDAAVGDVGTRGPYASVASGIDRAVNGDHGVSQPVPVGDGVGVG